MDPRLTSTKYIHQLLSHPDSLKALLLDEETATIISLLYNQSQLLENDVILVQNLSLRRKVSLSALQAIVFVRPTAENVRLLRLELRKPAFDSYKIVFTNVARRTYIEEIADADAEERVTEIREVYADYYALQDRLVSFEVCPCINTAQNRSAAPQNPQLERTVDGITALLLSLKKKPAIRYQSASLLCRNLAERVCVRINQDHSLFDFRSTGSQPLLLILDRREDPVTPLLNQWTYEAMIHELMGIRANRVRLTNSRKLPDQLQDFVLDDVDDQFYRENRFRNFGELGVNLKTLVDTFQQNSKSATDLSSIDDLMKFVAHYPEFTKSSSNISKHVALAGELSQLVAEMNLLEVSQLEQDIACREAESEHHAEIMKLLTHPKVTKSDKLRLVLLYSLRYEETSDKGLPAMKAALVKAGVQNEGIHLITAAKEYAGAARRSMDVFSNRSFLAKATNTVRRGIGGVENVYTQHEPVLVQTIDSLFRNKLRQTEFPLAEQLDIMESAPGEGSRALNIPAPREVLLLIAGGATYEEAKCISAINGGPHCFVPPEGSVTASAANAARQLRAQVALMGTCMHNSTSFAVEIMKNASAQREEHFIRPKQ